MKMFLKKKSDGDLLPMVLQPKSLYCLFNVLFLSDLLLPSLAFHIPFPGNDVSGFTSKTLTISSILFSIAFFFPNSHKANCYEKLVYLRCVHCRATKVVGTGTGRGGGEVEGACAPTNNFQSH